MEVESSVSANIDPTNLDDPELREALKRCSPATYYAACKFRQTGESQHVIGVIRGVLERYVDRDLKGNLLSPSGALRLREDLGLDSLSMIEVLMVAEDALRITISNDGLGELRTLADVQRFVLSKVEAAGSIDVRGSTGPQTNGLAH